MNLSEPTTDIRVLHLDGSPVHYRLAGPADGPVVVLTHGLSLDQHAYDAQVPALVAAGYRVLTWDLRGHGRSQPIGDGISVEGAARDLLALLDAVGAERAVLVGQSFGGMIVQECATRHPDRVAGLAVIGSPALGDRPNAVMRALQRLRIGMIRFWPDALLRRVFAAMVTRDPEVRAYVAAATAQVSRAAFLAVSAAAMDGHLRAEAAPTHRRPVLLVQGDREERPVARAMARWAAADPAARHVILPGGHLVNQESPESTNEVIIGFLGSVCHQIPVAEGDRHPGADEA